MSNVWLTSDLHIGHRKIAEIRSRAMDLNDVILDRYGTQPHDETLAMHWDESVGNDDVVWVLGDISSGTRMAQFGALEWIKRRPGIKHLIAGNHDSVHPLHRDSHKWFPAYMDVFDSVQMAAKRRVGLATGSHVTVLLSHFPYAGDHLGVDRYPEWRLRDAGHYILHGHTHGDAIDSWHPKQIHVGLDAWDFKPVPLDRVHQIVQRAESAQPQAWEDVPLPLEGI